MVSNANVKETTLERLIIKIYSRRSYSKQIQEIHYVQPLKIKNVWRFEIRKSFLNEALNHARMVF